jgi:TolB-like protein/Flp pilus assembly protein TadD
MDQALGLARQIAEGLAAAHAAGVIHRDLKPANVMVALDGGVKLLDFGLAKAIRPAAGDDAEAATRSMPLTQAGLVFGTPPYMSPEQWRGRSIDQRTDVWAFACVVYEMLCGVRPFGGESHADTAAAILEHDPDWTALPDDAPPALVKLLQRCLHKNPESRPSSMTEVLGELEGIRPETPASPPRHAAGTSDPTRALPRRPRPPHRPRLVPAVVVTLAVIVAAGLLLWSRQQSGRGALDPIDSIVVLPFENTSADPEGEYLSDGISESLINSLSRLPRLRVVPRGVAFGYKGRSVPLVAVAEELGVRAVVSGRVGERAGELVVGAELVDATNVSQLWGEQYRRPMADLLDVQEEIVHQIAEALRLELTPEQERRATDPATDNPEAYRLFLKTNFHTFRVTPEDLEKAVRYAQQAIELDPGFALAWVALSQAHMTRAFVGLGSWPEAGAISRAAAQRALELDDSLAEAWAERAFVEHHFDWDWVGAERSFARAVELDPTNADALQGHSEALVSLGRLDEAVAKARQAVAANPLSAHHEQWLGFTYYAMRSYDEARAAFARALEIEPDHTMARAGAASVLLAAGRYDEALASLEHYLRWVGADPTAHPRMAAFYAAGGRLAEAREIADGLEVEELDEQGRADLALALVGLGELDRAFDLLDGLLDVRSRALLFANTRPSWDPLRVDPRYDTMLERMGLPRV